MNCSQNTIDSTLSCVSDKLSSLDVVDIDYPDSEPMDEVISGKCVHKQKDNDEELVCDELHDRLNPGEIENETLSTDGVKKETILEFSAQVKPEDVSIFLSSYLYYMCINNLFML